MKMKKIAALLLAVVMVLAMGATAFASDAENGDTANDGIAGNTNGVWSSVDTPVVQGNSVILYKEITAYNPEDAQTINAPTITYTYTITGGDQDKEIYDAAGNHSTGTNAHAYTKTGVGTPAVTTSLDLSSYTTAGATNANKLQITPAVQMTANSTGYANKYGIKITFDPTAFTGAGVYRYVVTEAADTYESSGVVNGTISETRYLDVYVKDAATAGQYEIYGYVCFQNNNDIDSRTTSSTSTVTQAAKTEGFVATSTGGTDGTTAQTADQYYTFNLTVKKSLVGDYAKNGNKFPFHVTFSNTTVAGNVLPIVTSGGTVTKPTLTTAAAISSFNLDGLNGTGGNVIALAHDGWVTFTGIPAGTTVTIDEYNNVGGTVYNTTTSGATVNEAEGISLTWSAWASDNANWADKTDGSGTVTALGGTANTNAAASTNFTATGAGVVLFTNTLLTISPTGYVARIAPYAIMLGTGIFLLVLTKRRKKDEEEAEA